MTESEARKEICRVGRSLYERGYVHASAGNISVKLVDGFLMTPTDACMGDLEAAKLARLDLNGVQVDGDRASKSWMLHRSTYTADPTAQCVLHTHSTHLVALSLAGVWSLSDILPPITPYYVMKVGHVPLIPYQRPGDPKTAECVAQAIATAHSEFRPLRAVMLERLGPHVWHRSPAEASAVLEELEETAKLWLMTSPRPGPLDGKQLAELADAFRAQW